MTIESVAGVALLFLPFLVLGMVLPSGSGTTHAPLARIIPNPGQARKSFPRADIELLAASLKERGQLNPIIVRYDAGRDVYILSSGERRYLAMKLLGWEEAEVKILDREPDEADMLEESIVENEIRQSLNPIELGKALERLQVLKGGAMQSIAESLHVNAVRASRAVSLLTLPPRVQAMVAEEKIGFRAACSIVRFPSEAEQSEIADAVAAGKLTCLQVEDMLAQRVPKRSTKPKGETVSAKEGDYSITVTGKGMTVKGLLEAVQAFARKLGKKAAAEGMDVEKLAEVMRNGGAS